MSVWANDKLINSSYVYQADAACVLAECSSSNCAASVFKSQIIFYPSRHFLPLSITTINFVDIVVSNRFNSQVNITHIVHTSLFFQGP